MKTILFVSAIALCAMPVFAQEKPKLEEDEIAPPRKMSMKQVLSGKTFPLMYQLKDLNTEWHAFNMSDGGANSLSLLYSIYGAGLGAGNSYFTRGEEVSIGSETFVIAYHPKQKLLNLALMSAPAPSPELTDSLKMKEDSVLMLSLVNLRSASVISELRGFDMKEILAQNDATKETPTETSDKLKGISSDSNLRQVALAIAMYAQDYDSTLPPMKTYAKFKEAVMPYVKNEAFFQNPISKEDFVLNDILSSHKLAHIINPTEFAAIYEANPAPDGTRVVGYVDGHIKRVDAAEWQLVKRRSKMK